MLLKKQRRRLVQVRLGNFSMDCLSRRVRPVRGERCRLRRGRGSQHLAPSQAAAAKAKKSA
jgi:hypothetical protein